MQGLTVLATIVDEIAWVNEIVEGWTDGCTYARMDPKLDAYVAPCHQVQQYRSI